MIKYEDECFQCATESYPCLGSACPNRRVPHLYCDSCDEEVDELYEVEEKQLCAECALKTLEKVEV